jgi:peptide/nickel transport system permease protein
MIPPLGGGGPGAAASPKGGVGVKAARASTWAGLAIVATYVVIAAAAPILPLADPYGTDYGAVLQPPSASHWFGTDDVGRDIFSRVVYGARLDLAFGLAGAYFSLVIGLVAGAVAGYFGGWRETTIMRIVDVTFAFPFIVLVLVMVAVVGPGVLGVYVGVIVASWPLYARLTYSEMRVLREREFILAARTLGFRDRHVILRHAIPNVFRPNLVISLSDLISNILVFASLSYLGVGVQPPTAEWGSIIAGGQTYLLTAWWISTLPGLVVVVFGVGASLLGEGLADRWSTNAAALF